MENKIILIEDDEEIRSMVKDYLSGEFQVFPFSEGKTAIHTVKNYDEYSLALIDLMLPDMSGMEIIKTIRQASTIPIIIITAKDNDTDKSLGLNLGADDYVVKPFSLIELTARIILSEVDLIADTIGIIQHGNLLAELPIEEIHKHQTEYISLQVDDVAHAATLLEQMDITNFSVLDQEFIRIYDSNISGKVLSKALIESGVGLESLGRKQDTLEDYFFQLTEERK